MHVVRALVIGLFLSFAERTVEHFKGYERR